MRLRTPSLMLVSLVAACTPAGGSLADAPLAAEPSEVNSAQVEPRSAHDEPSSSCDPRAMRACFGELELVAGLARERRKGINGWKPEFEGADAREVELSRPHFVMADASGAIFIADKDADAVRKISPAGTITTVAAAPLLRAPNGLWVRADGTVYVLDLGHSRVLRLAPDTSHAPLFTVDQGIQLGRGLWVADDESSAFVASGSKVLRWTAAAGVETYASGFAGLGNLVVDPSGALVVTDRSAGRIYRVAADGEKTLIAGSGGLTGAGELPALDSPLPGVRALWFDRSGGFFFGTHESSAVGYVDPEGILHAFLDDRELSEVRGLSQTRRGDLLIVDHDGGRVWRMKRKL